MGEGARSEGPRGCHWPSANTGCYVWCVSTPTTPSGLLLAETDVEFRYNDAARTFPCKIYFDLKRTRTLLIEPLESVKAICADPGDGAFFLSISGVAKPVECSVASSTLRFGGKQPGTFVRLVPHRLNIEVDSPSPLVRVNAGVLNLGHYVFPTPGGMSAFTLFHEDWLFDFTPVTEVTTLYDPSIQDESYFFTHHVSLHKLGDALFSCSEAHHELDLLCTFLSFCHGHWVSTALVAGVDENGVVAMEEWGTRELSAWCETTNWLDQHHGTCMAELFPLFVRLIATSPEWKATIEHAIYWYIRADTGLIGPDGGCILLQAALERLAWHLLVRDRRSISDDGFAKLPAADQLRLLLSALSIPLALPAELADLQTLAKELNWVDGPQAFVEIRNRLVHPSKLRRQEQRLPYYEAFRLGKWYVELAILSTCGYGGVYSNRTRERRWIGKVEPVPWSS